MTENQSNSTSGNGLAIAGLVVGIAALLFSFIPCLGAYAIYPGGVGVVLSGIGLFLLIKSSGQKGLAIAALSVSLLATIIAGFQYVALKSTMGEVENSFSTIGSSFQQQLDSIQAAQPGLELEINEKIDSLMDLEGLELNELIDTLE